MTDHSVLLRFSFFEHDWDESIEGAAAMEAELLRRAAQGSGWRSPTRSRTSSPRSTSCACVPRR
ncbi:hypothetical protein ACFQZ4_38750 [Catellatospora coxensis]